MTWDKVFHIITQITHYHKPAQLSSPGEINFVTESYLTSTSKLIAKIIQKLWPSG